MILVVEDDQAICESLKLLFEMEHLDVKITCSVSEAIEFLSENKVDVILLDYFLGKQTGDAVIKYVVENYGFYRPKIVLITAAMHPEKLGLKVDDIIKKPFHIDELLTYCR